MCQQLGQGLDLSRKTRDIIRPHVLANDCSVTLIQISGDGDSWALYRLLSLWGLCPRTVLRVLHTGDQVETEQDLHHLLPVLDLDPHHGSHSILYFAFPQFQDFEQHQKAESKNGEQETKQRLLGY